MTRQKLFRILVAISRYGLVVLKLQKQTIKETPFTGGKTLKFQIGILLNEENIPQFRYTRSLEKVRSFYRVILQVSSDETYIPYVFDIAKNDSQKLVIEPESDDARKAWLMPVNAKTNLLRFALETIYREDIDLV